MTNEQGQDEVLGFQVVPLGDPDAMKVRRTLPQKRRSLISAWCFLDHFGPDTVTPAAGMQVARHPHTCLATVSWLFQGQVDHIDSAGHQAEVHPGELNLMTAGTGISHSEFSRPGPGDAPEESGTLHGVQLWFAFPDADRLGEPGFQHYRPEPVQLGETQALVFLGSLAGAESPVATPVPMVGAEMRLAPDDTVKLDVRADFEHGVLADTGTVTVDGAEVTPGNLAYLAPGHDTLRLSAGPEGARLILIGGVPLGEQIVIWWNFVGRTHEEIAEYRAAWQTEIGLEPGRVGPGMRYSDGAPYPRFGTFPEGTPAPIPAPPIPNFRLLPRG